MLRTWVVLGRVSNLPTVWSNCLAGWLLAGLPPNPSLALVLGGASLLYTGGMFLNDAYDAGFDRIHRPERPIPRGHITTRAVYGLAAASLVAGIVLVAPLGPQALRMALLIVAGVIVYTWLHKTARAAMLVMAFCRSMLYWMAATASVDDAAVLLPSIGLGVYVLGVSLIARAEHESPAWAWWMVLLMIVPVPLALAMSTGSSVVLTGAAALLFLLWIVRTRSSQRASERVPRLLAGMPLIDMLFVVTVGGPYWSFPIFAVLLASALLLQKRVPAS